MGKESTFFVSSRVERGVSGHAKTLSRHATGRDSRALRGVAGHLVPPHEQLQLPIPPPQGFYPGLPVTLSAQEPPEFGHRADRIA